MPLVDPLVVNSCPLVVDMFLYEVIVPLVVDMFPTAVIVPCVVVLPFANSVNCATHVFTSICVQIEKPFLKF